MKKYIFAMAALVLLAGCKNDEPLGPNYPEPVKGVSYVFEGTVATDGFTWNTDSKVGVYALTEGVKAVNLECPIEGWANPNLVDEETHEPLPYDPSPYTDKAVAPFNSPKMDLVKGPNKFLVYTPYDSELSYFPSTGVIYNLSIAADQTQAKPNVAGGCFAIGYAEAIPGKDEKFEFSLNPVTSMLKVNVSSSEFEGYGLKKVTIYDEAGELALGGTFDVNVNELSVATYETVSKVATTIDIPVAMKSGETQSIFINVLPGDFSANELTVVVELVGDKGSVTIPMKKNGGKWDAGKITEFNITDLKSSDCSVKWFCPVETRLQSALGYAYGESNTYLIQCKNGNTYTGATYSPVDEYPSSVVIDYRARGNFSEAIDPTGATFEWFVTPNSTVNGGQPFGAVNNKFKTYFGIETTSVNTVVIDESKFKFTVDEANYRVTVENVGLFASAPILVMKKEGKILWAWTFWNISADGTKLEGIDVAGHKIANMDIGQNTLDFAKWATNSNPAWSTTYRYQWGRYAPASVYTTGLWNLSAGDCTNGTIPGILGQVDFKTALANPVAMIIGANRGDDPVNWTSDFYGDLWGGNVKGDIEGIGVKSIYDPCPKGWRVADPTTLIAISQMTATQNTTQGQQGFKMGSDIVLLSVGYINGKADASKTTEYRLATMGGAFTSANYAFLWSNYIGGHKSNMPTGLNYGNSVTGGEPNAKVKKAIMNRSVAAPVRCEVDTDNR